MDFFVSVSGNDTYPGTQTAPFATLSAARDAVRTVVGGGLTEPVTVHIGAGEYRMHGITFDNRDSGTGDCPITYQADGEVVLHGGISVGADAWLMPDDDMAARFADDARPHIRMISLTSLGLTRRDWGEEIAIGAYETSAKYDDAPRGCGCEFFTGGRRMTKARYPNDGFAKLEAVMDVGEVREFPPQNYHRDWFDRRNHRGGAYIIDRETAKRVEHWKTPDLAWMFGYFYWDWADSSTPVTFKIENRVVYPKFVSGFAARAGANYYFYNVPEELDAEGEWYLDRETGNLYFWPWDGAQTADFSCRGEPLITCNDTKYLTFSGFTVMATMGDGIHVNGDDMRLERLTVKNIAGTAIRVNGYRNTVSDCEITRTGKGGIHVTGGDRATLTHGDNRVTNNYIHDFSEIYLTYQGGIDLRGVGNIADHNEICGSPHSAIFYGGNEHLIEYNDIHDVVLLSSDAGAIYAGFDWAAHGCVVRYNRLRDIGANGFTPDGIYWDDGHSGQTAYGNILINVKKFSVLVGGGRENMVHGNLIVDSGQAALQYDDRNRDGFVHGGWARAATNTPDAPHWKHLEEVPYKEEPWYSRYPRLHCIKTSFETDPDDVDFPINPAYSHVTENVVIAPRGDMYQIADSVYTYSEVADNTLYDTYEAAGWDCQTGWFADDSPVLCNHPAIAAIPVSEIGRKNK